MAEALLHISSAIVRTRPEHTEAVSRRLAALPGTEVHRAEDGRIVIVLEGAGSGANGARLAEIALLDGVLAASLVYEQTETLESPGDAT